MLIQV